MKKKPIEIDPTLILLTPSEAARRLSISLDVMRRQIQAGEFPLPRRIGRNTRFYVEDINAYAESLPSHIPRYNRLRDYHDTGSFADRMKTHEERKMWRERAVKRVPVESAPEIEEWEKYRWKGGIGSKGELPLP
jgi:excisionase family DNA binding protein